MELEVCEVKGGYGAKLVIDGVSSITLSPGDRIDVTHAPWRSKFVRTVKDDFYQKLQYRLKQSDSLQ